MIIKLYYKTIKSRQNLLYKGKKNLDPISSYQISRKINIDELLFLI